jgi:hypothetical protein
MAKYALKDGVRVRVSTYDHSLMLTMRDLFPNDSEVAARFLVKKVDAPKGKLKHLYNTKNNTAILRKVFISYVKLVLSEISKGNCCFTPPSIGAGKPMIHMDVVTDSIVRKRRQRNQLARFDLSKSGFKVPSLKYRISPSSRKKDYGIYVNSKIYDLLVNTSNQGKVFSNLPKDVYYFLPHIYKEYDYLVESRLEAMIKYCFRRLHKAIKDGEEIRILDSDGEIRFHRILGKHHDKIMTEVVKKRLKREREEKYGTNG